MEGETGERNKKGGKGVVRELVKRLFCFEM